MRCNNLGYPTQQGKSETDIFIWVSRRVKNCSSALEVVSFLGTCGHNIAPPWKLMRWEFSYIYMHDPQELHYMAFSSTLVVTSQKNQCLFHFCAEAYPTQKDADITSLPKNWWKSCIVLFYNSQGEWLKFSFGKVSGKSLSHCQIEMKHFRRKRFVLLSLKVHFVIHNLTYLTFLYTITRKYFLDLYLLLYIYLPQICTKWMPTFKKVKHCNTVHNWQIKSQNLEINLFCVIFCYKNSKLGSQQEPLTDYISGEDRVGIWQDVWFLQHNTVTREYKSWVNYTHACACQERCP